MDLTPKEIAESIHGFNESHLTEGMETEVIVQVDEEDFRTVEDVQLDDDIVGKASIVLRLGGPGSANL